MCGGCDPLDSKSGLITFLQTSQGSTGTTTEDPPDKLDPPLAAPSLSKNAPQHIKDLITDESPTLPTTPNLSIALTVKQPLLDKTHPYNIKGVTLTYDWKKHDINTPVKNLNSTLIFISKLQRSAHQKKLTISFRSSTRKSCETLDTDAYEYFKTTSAYTPDPTIIPMSNQFIQLFKFLLDIDVFPKLLKD